jgi:phospholipid/cholesterol/gamma-HCH transport system substrate-binding protein
METRAGYFIVGSFVLISLAGILSFFLWLAKNDLDYNVNYYTIYFPGSVTGLTIGGSVNYLGVPVGTVKNIQLDAKNLERVNITVAIRDSIPIREDAYASLELQGLTGYKLVQLYGGAENAPLLKAKENQTYPVIPSRYSGVEEIMTTLPRMVNKFTNLVDRINATFNEQNRTRFSEALKNVDILAQRLAESSEPLKALVHDTHQTINSVGEDVKKLSESAKNTFESVDGVAKDLSIYLKYNRAALETLTQAGSYEILQTLGETREMVTKASQFFDKLDENPSSLIFDTQRKGISVPQ